MKERPGLRWHTEVELPNQLETGQPGRWCLASLGEQLRASWMSILVAVVVAGVPFWWPTEHVADGLFAALLVVLAAGLLGMFLAIRVLVKRYRADRELIAQWATRLRRAQQATHVFSDTSRDLIAHATARLEGARARKISKSGNEGTGFLANQYGLFRNDIRELVSKAVSSLQRLMGDARIAVSIRIGIPRQDGSGTVDYYTIASEGRGTSSRRMQTSESVSSEVGVHRTLLEHRGEGVLHYHDLEAAAKDGTFVETYNHRTYREIGEMAVVPISFRNGSHFILLGSLHITTPGAGLPVAPYLDVLRTIADDLAAFMIVRYRMVKDASALLGVFQESGEPIEDYISFVNLALEPIKRSSGIRALSVAMEERADQGSAGQGGRPRSSGAGRASP